MTIALLTLEAAGEMFPRRLSAKSMRRELRKHGLPIVVIAGKHFVEPPTIDKLVQRCRVLENPPASFSATAQPERSGSSETGHGTNAQGWVDNIANRLSRPSPPMSPPAAPTGAARPRRGT